MSKHHTATKRPADPDMPALRRHRQSLLAILLATTALIAAGGLAPARAQNCDPGNTCLYDESGTSGKDGTDGSGDNPGNDGTDGTPGGDILGLQLDNIMDLATDGSRRRCRSPRPAAAAGMAATAIPARSIPGATVAATASPARTAGRSA